MRQLKLIQDRYGRLWLGPQDIDPEGDLPAQGCWRCHFRDPLGGAWQTDAVQTRPRKSPAEK